MKSKKSKFTISVHVGSSGDPQYKGVTNPIYTSSAYDYENEVIYPRYFNTPNQVATAKKIAALENAQDGLLFSSGMAAIMTSLLTFVKQGDHIIFQRDLYGGTYHAILNELKRFGIEFTFVDAQEPDNFRKAIRKNTKLLYIETPSNPLLKITDIEAVAKIARVHKLISIIDNTFASPVNQNPIDLGIDVVAHSATKYIGGHNDLLAGAVASNKKFTEKIKGAAMHFGGSLDAYTCYLIERSLKTIVLRVQQQNKNAMALAKFMEAESKIARVFYPGIKNSEGYAIAKKQMTGGYGGMLSFELKGKPDRFLGKLKYIKRAISLGGVESTISSPARTSHAKLTLAERKQADISDRLLRFSVGIEDANDLIEDIKNAL